MEGGGGCSLQTTDQPGMNPMRRDNQSELLFFLGGGLVVVIVVVYFKCFEDWITYFERTSWKSRYYSGRIDCNLELA